MEREEKEVAATWLTSLRQLPYSELERRYFKKPTIHDATARSGKVYQLETFAIWNNKKTRTLVVLVSIPKQAESRVYRPVTESFIIAPDGSFVGE